MGYRPSKGWIAAVAALAIVYGYFRVRVQAPHLMGREDAEFWTREQLGALAVFFSMDAMRTSLRARYNTRPDLYGALLGAGFAVVLSAYLWLTPEVQPTTLTKAALRLIGFIAVGFAIGWFERREGRTVRGALQS